MQGFDPGENNQQTKNCEWWKNKQIIERDFQDIKQRVDNIKWAQALITKVDKLIEDQDRRKIVFVVGTKGGDIVLKVCDKKNDTSNNFDIVVGESATADYTFYFKVENLKMISGDYDVSVSSKSISHFKNKKLPIEYWIALEPDSTINK